MALILAKTVISGSGENGFYNKAFCSELQGKGKGKVCIRASVAHQAGAYPGFCSRKRLGD